MKSVRDGILYDTDDAELISSWIGYVPCSVDGVGMRTARKIYRTKNGNFFSTNQALAEKGFFAKLFTGMWSDGEVRIYPMVPKAAMSEMVMLNIDPAKYGLELKAA